MAKSLSRFKFSVKDNVLLSLDSTLSDNIRMVNFQGRQRIVGNSRGQMAIFIALIFQVLFVLFAMVINVGMLVHDKINLQNSVDIAAYYAAQKQAEMLNAIAHQNYQVRQAWKLLTFRYWVLGSISYSGHPSFPLMLAGEGSPSDLYEDGPYAEVLEDGTLSPPPQVCVISSLWIDQPFKDSNQNLCKRVSTRIRLPEVPKVFIGALNALVAQFFGRANAEIGTHCKSMGAYNYLLGAQFYYSFRQDQANRRWTIRRLADQMSADEGDFRDIKGDSVLEGVKKVVLKNLTSPNREGDPQIALYNSLAQGRTREAWLQDILVAPGMIYSDTTSCTGEVKVDPKPMVELPLHAAENAALLASLQEIMNWVAGFEPNDPRDPMHSSVGVEKNPWYMAYVGVNATTRPRKPFSPFAGSVSLTARAFAKPFGGRIGPWYGTTWPRGSLISLGATEDTKVDALLPQRQNAGGTDPYVFFKNIPNYSRYPGDRLGMNSWLSLRILHNSLSKSVVGGGFGALMVGWFAHLLEPLGEPNRGNSARDPLAWNSTTNVAPWVRYGEIASIAPNLFDATYYSIEPNYYQNYFQPFSGAANLGTNGPSGVRGDLGSRLGMGDEFAGYSIKDQISRARTFLSTVFERYSYQISSPDHLLTGWSSNSATDYTFPKQFGKCEGDPLKDVPNPGDCVAGGRVGYSVKIINRDYLFGSRHNYGNDGTQDTILNPPPEDF